jgi:phage shock protein PspC (stress-responsive transcriptional regulator)
MKKTLTISISGTVFHIEEDAYHKLHRYLEAIGSHFKDFQGKAELIADIESRIAEILQQKLSDSRQVITQTDVDEVIAIMGQPSDYSLEDDDPLMSGSGVYMRKRLYRDGERKMIGGVAAGLGAYFGIDPVWIRIIFIALIFTGGFGLLVYLILWLAVPEAITNAEKLEMRGEPVNLSNLERSLENEAGQIREKLNDLTAKARQTYRKRADEIRNRHGHSFGAGLGEVGRLLLRVMIIFCGFIILMIGLGLTLVYLSILFRFPVITVMEDSGFHAFPLYALSERIFANDGDLRTFITGIMVLAGIPLLMLLWSGIRLIFTIPRVKAIGSIAGIAWLCALVITLIFGFKLANSFRGSGEFTREHPLSIGRNDTLYVVAESDLHLEDDWGRNGTFYFDEARLAIKNDKQVIYGVPLLKFKTSSDSTAMMLITTNARGRSTDDAIETAERVEYYWKQRNDTLYLSDHIVLAEKEKWRKQETRVELQLPEGTHVSIDNKLRPILGYHKNISRRDRIGNLYYMDNNGLIKK